MTLVCVSQGDVLVHFSRVIRCLDGRRQSFWQDLSPLSFWLIIVELDGFKEVVNVCFARQIVDHAFHFPDADQHFIRVPQIKKNREPFLFAKNSQSGNGYLLEGPLLRTLDTKGERHCHYVQPSIPLLKCAFRAVSYTIKAWLTVFELALELFLPAMVAVRT